MAKFPVEAGDLEGIVDGVNYVLSGPSGLGQNFGGINYSEPAWLTGNLRPPATRLPISTVAYGADTGTSITVNDPTGIVIGQYVIGQGIGTNAVVGAAYTTGSVTVPLTVANVAPVSGTINFYETVPDNLYIAAITISTSECIDVNTRKFTFAAAQPAPPFLLGNSPTVATVSIAGYNQKYMAVVECTTTYVIVKSITPQTVLANGAGGTIRYQNTILGAPAGTNAYTDTFTRTDCQARLSVTGPTDRVFINATLDNTIYYQSTTTGDVQYTVYINRYLLIPNNDPINPDFLSSFSKTIAERVYTLRSSFAPVNGDRFDTIFGSVIDQPPIGYYLYRLEVQFRNINTSGTTQVLQSEVRLRSLTGQVVKQ